MTLNINDLTFSQYYLISCMNNIKILFYILIFAIEFPNAQNYQEIQRLQEEYKKALNRHSLQKPNDISEAENTAKSAALPDKLIYSRKDIESLLVNTEKLLNELKFYQDSTFRMPYIGYDFFSKRDTIPFWQNLPISNEYILGPGDEVIIALWGNSNSLVTKTINRDGQIFIENIGILNLGGKSLPKAKEYVVSKYSRVYSTLTGDSPKSFIDLTLGELKSINIHFIGFVNIPGVHLVHPFSNIITGLIQAGGVDNKGSLREISIIRNNTTIATVDIYNYLIKGVPPNNFRLLDQDVIHVPPRKSTVPITGRVLRPGYYEAVENETLANLISLAGGRDRLSTRSVFVHRNNFFDKSGYIINENELSGFKIMQGDSIHIPLQPTSDSFIKIDGQIKNPGDYPFNKSLTLRDLVYSTMSFEDKDFYETMDLKNINIYRKNESDKTPLEIKTDLNDDIVLMNGDHVNIPRLNILMPIESVKITGQVMNPGIYPVNNLTTLSEIISISGGYTNLALEGGVEVFRDSLQISWKTNEFFLSDGDSINVLKKSGLILVEGEVHVPGYLSFRKNDSVKKYIKRAGGLTSYAEPNNIYVVYPNGTSVPISVLRPPKVKEGSKIVVNQRSLLGEGRTSGWEVFSIISSQAGNIATTLLSLSILINQSQNAN